MPNTYMIATVAVAAIITAALRFAPFLIFGRGKETPALVVYLGKVLPYAIMGMLVVYCMKDVKIASAPHGLPELLGCIIVAALHVWRRNTLLSIGAGTVCYMLMVQFLF